MHAATRALQSWLLHRRVPVVTPDPRDESIALAFGNAYRVTVVAYFLFATVMCVGATAVLLAPLPIAIVVGAFFVMLWLATLYALYDAFFVVVKASARGLQSNSLLFGARSLPWEDIERVAYAALGNWYTFRSSQGWAIRVSIYRNGLKSFAQLVSANIDRSPANVTQNFYRHTR